MFVCFMSPQNPVLLALFTSFILSCSFVQISAYSNKTIHFWHEQMLEIHRSPRKCLRSACKILCLTTKMSCVMHSILKTSYFFDKVVEIDLLKVQYLRTTSEASLINLFLQLLDRVAEEEAIHCEVCLHSSSVAFAKGRSSCFCLSVPVNTLSYAVGYFCAQKQDDVLCIGYSCSPK